jgi:hypothetical protein
MFIDRKTMNLRAPFEGAELNLVGIQGVSFRPVERRTESHGLSVYQHLTP